MEGAQLGAELCRVKVSICLVNRKGGSSPGLGWKIKFSETGNKLLQGLFIDGLPSVFARYGPYSQKWENAISHMDTHDDSLEGEINYTHNSLGLIFWAWLD